MGDTPSSSFGLSWLSKTRLAQFVFQAPSTQKKVAGATNNTMLLFLIMKRLNTTSEKTSLNMPWLSFTIFLGSALLFLILGAVPDTLIYNRTAIENGEIWRLLSSHFVHCDLAHLGWNITALFILGSLLEQRLGTRLLGLLAISCIGVSSWLWFFKTDLTLYCGLSGILNGLFSALLFILWRENKHPVLPLIGIAAVVKSIVEASTQQALFTHLSWDSVPGAHGAGMIAGCLYFFITMVPKETIPRTRFSTAYRMEHGGQDL
ncbi:MAG TPA: rhombosortase [Desulfocapsa sulfexigens]|nr:rhombosortase [Desulfocapsa sulfexigens]